MKSIWFGMLFFAIGGILSAQTTVTIDDKNGRTKMSLLFSGSY